MMISIDEQKPIRGKRIKVVDPGNFPEGLTITSDNEGLRIKGKVLSIFPDHFGSIVGKYVSMQL